MLLGLVGGAVLRGRGLLVLLVLLVLVLDGIRPSPRWGGEGGAARIVSRWIWLLGRVAVGWGRGIRVVVGRGGVGRVVGGGLLRRIVVGGWLLRGLHVMGRRGILRMRRRGGVLIVGRRRGRVLLGFRGGVGDCWGRLEAIFGGRIGVEIGNGGVECLDLSDQPLCVRLTTATATAAAAATTTTTTTTTTAFVTSPSLLLGPGYWDTLAKAEHGIV